MSFPGYPSPHVHIDSFDSASNAEAFAKKEVELGTGAITVTDHGSLSVVRKVYDLAHSKEYRGKLTPILGLEGYFRDDDCPILLEKGLQKDKDGKFLDEDFKYGHITMHLLDEEAYSTCSRILSAADFRAERHGKEKKPLFNWRDIEELGSKNITMTSSCLIGMVNRHMMARNDFQTAIKYYERLRASVKPGNFYVEVFPHVCDTFYDSAVFVTFEDDTTQRFPDWKNFRTDKHKGDAKHGIKAGKLARLFVDNPARFRLEHNRLVAIMEDRKWQELNPPKEIKLIEIRQGFLKNECRAWAPDGDLQLGHNRFVLELAQRYGDPVLISDDAHFANPEEKIVQDIRLQQGGGAWRFSNVHHRVSSDQAWNYFRDVMKVDQSTFEYWIENNWAWSGRFKDFKFSPRITLPTKFYPSNTLEHTIELVRKHGRMDWHKPEYFDRLKSEIDLLHYNGTIDLLTYFFILEEIDWEYEKRGELAGPGRGSAAGMLLAYVLDITHVDPLERGLSRDRFLTLDRIQSGKFPDIDQDLPSRDILVDPEDPTKGWLRDRFGDCYAQISTDTTMKLKSSIKDVFRALYGRVDPTIEAICGDLPDPPQGITDHDFVFGYKSGDGTWTPGVIEKDGMLQYFVQNYPKEWEIIKRCLGLVRQKGRHACGFIISNEPIANFIPLTTIDKTRVTQFTATSVEAMGALKVDFLNLNSLKDIAVCIKLVQARSGVEIKLNPKYELPSIEIKNRRVPIIRVIPHRGEFYDIWKLPEDQAVFNDMCESKTESVFQFNTPGARQLLSNFNEVSFVENGEVHKGLDSIEDLSAFTALDRPGPLDYPVEDPVTGKKHNMLVEFANRAKNKAKIGSFPILDRLFPETYGVIVYQEQLQQVFQEVGKATAIEANNFRIHISKKQMSNVIKDRAIFMRGAVETIGKEAAEQLWNSMETFGQYGFNKSHSMCYVTIGYACAWLKHYYPLEWWTAVLRHADKDEIDTKFWRYCGHLITIPDINVSSEVFEIRGDKINAPLSFLNGIGENAHKQLMAGKPYANIEDLCQKIKKHKEDNKTVDAETGKEKKGHSSLHRGNLYPLVASGSLDSLFAPDILFEEKFMLLEAALARAESKKNAKPVNPLYQNTTPLIRYQLCKKVSPSFSSELFGSILSLKSKGFTEEIKGIWTYEYRDQKYRIVGNNGLNRLSEIVPVPEGGIAVGVCAYILNDERKDYFRKTDNKKCTRAEITLDIDGHRLTTVMWPSRKTGEIENLPATSIAGSIAIVVLYRSRDEGPFYIDGVEVIQPPLPKKLDEESK